jgi:hypothetical protein
LGVVSELKETSPAVALTHRLVAFPEWTLSYFLWVPFVCLNQFGAIRLQFHTVTDGHNQMEAAVSAFVKTRYRRRKISLIGSATYAEQAAITCTPLLDWVRVACTVRIDNQASVVHRFLQPVVVVALAAFTKKYREQSAETLARVTAEGVGKPSR